MSLPSQTILMCAPDYFGVNYVINPWMEGQIGDTDRDIAQKQWDHLRDEIAKHAKVVLQPPQPGLPDIVFTANASIVLGNKVIVSRFRSVERQGEEPHDHAWFKENGFDILDWPQNVPFEGAGDALFDRGQELLWVGHGFRSDMAVPALLEKMLGRKTVTLKLVDPRFYHLDTCLCPLKDGYLLYFPAAFDAESRALIEKTVPQEKRIAVEEADALKFCCNAVDLDGFVLMNDASESLQKRLRDKGFTPVVTPLSEFLKAGGGAKCLTLKLVEP
ncbi:MAG: arginine deiminase-related protein [Alphaproteobacteria bacterium]